jgi:hypothetical protein
MIDEKVYQAYLIRFRRDEGQLHWWATLQNAQSGEVLNFANEDHLLDFLLKTLKGNILEQNE